MMQDRQPVRRRIPVGVAAGLSALVLATGGATAWWTWNSMTQPKKDTAPTVIQPSPSPQPVQPSVTVPPPTAPGTSDPAKSSQSSQNTKSPVETTVQVYWLQDTGRSIKLAPSQAAVDTSADKPSVVLAEAFNDLLAGPVNSDVTTTIPKGTKLRNVAVRNDGIHVDLSQEFATGGGSASMTGRVAQVLYTATTLEPNARVWISVEGKPLELLGGEGVVIDQPITRQSFERDFPI